MPLLLCTMFCSSFACGETLVDEGLLTSFSHVPFPVFDGIMLKFEQGNFPCLVCEWDVHSGCSPIEFAKAKSTMLLSTVSDVQFEALAESQTVVWLDLSSPPSLAIGLQEWDESLFCRCQTQWGRAAVGCSALPHRLREELSQPNQYSFTLDHPVEMVQLEFTKGRTTSQLAVRELSPPPSRKRSVLSPVDKTSAKKSIEKRNKLRKILEEMHASLANQKQMGSIGERSDGCASVRPEDDDECRAEMLVCDRCVD